MRKRLSWGITVAASALAAAALIWSAPRLLAALTAPMPINLTVLAGPFNNPIGIDDQDTSGQLVASVNWISGNPHNFDLIDPVTGVHSQFTALAGMTDEIKLATIHQSANTGGFTVGDIYAGNGTPGQIMKISADGSTVVNPWVVLPGETAHVRGSLFQDRYGAFSGDLIVVTGNEQSEGDPLVGKVWRITAAGVPTLVRDFQKHLEGVTTVPNDVATYGPIAGRILVGDEDRVISGMAQKDSADGLGTGCHIFAVAANGTYITLSTAPTNLMAAIPNYHVPVALCPEDLDIVRKNATFFGVNFSDGRILKAPGSDFANVCGAVLVTDEFPSRDSSVAPPVGVSGLNLLRWNSTTNEFDVTPLSTSLTINQWEHVTFSGGSDCTDVTIVKYTNDADANDPNAAGVPNVAPGGTVTWTYKVTNTGHASVPRAQVVVTDNTTGVTPVFSSELSGNGDMIFDPGEVWLYTATGTALDLTLPPPSGVHTVPNSCTAGGTQPPRTAYTNVGTVTIPGATASDPSSYCNPPPNVTIIKYTNGADANDPNAAGVPNVAPGGTVTWTYKVTNTGQTSVPRAQVVVTDNTTGVTPVFSSEQSGNGDAIFDPGEVWLYTATGTALNLTLPPPSGVHTVPNSCTAGGTQPPRTAYTNVGTVTIPGASATDPSSYCNPPPSSKGITIGPSSMEGAIKIDAGDWVNGGYSFKTNFSGNITIAATVSITGKCIGGSLPSDTLTVNLGSVAYAAVAGSDWKPTGDANSILSWQGSVVAPASMCGGGQLDASKGAVFTANISGAPAGGLVTFRFKFRDPAAKGKPNTNCLDANDPNRNRADVCGASWSATKTDP